MRKNDRKSRVRQIRKSKKTNRKNRIAKAKILNSKKYLDISLRTIIVKHQSEILNNSIDKETIDKSKYNPESF
ncbi:hypothetical protein ACPSKX_04070 [Moritella viscosa]